MPKIYSQKNINIVLPISIALLMLLTLSIYIVLPVNQRYYVLDTGPWGYSKLSRDVTWVQSIQDLKTVDSSRTLLIIARENYLDRDEVEVIKEFIEKNGLALIYGEPLFIVDFLVNLGVDAEYLGDVVDPVNTFNDNVVHIYIDHINSSAFLVSPYTIAIYNINSSISIDVIAFTSTISYLDKNGNGYYDIGEPLDRYPVVFLIRIGSGEIVVFCARGVLTNNVVDLNRGLLEILSKNRVGVLDQSWVKHNSFLYLKLYLVTPRGVSPIYISIAVVLLVLVGIYVYRFLEKR